LSGARAGRDATLDLLRGYFLAVMIVDHLRSFPSLFEPFTGRGRMWASAAEGFFAVSGCLVGILRGAEVRRGRFQEAAAKLLRRSGRLYLWSVGLTLLYTAWGRLMIQPPAVTLGLVSDPPLRLVLKAICLRYTYGLADILPLYALFLAAAPLALVLLSRGQTLLVLAASLSVWIGGLLMPAAINLTRSSLSDFSWQACFFLALVAGYHAGTLRSLWARLGEGARSLGLITVAALSVGLGYLSWLDRFRNGLWPAHPGLSSFLFDKVRVGPGRLAVAAVWLVFLYAIVKRFEPAVMRWTGWFLEPLGRNSLYVYIVQSALVFPLFNLFVGSFWLATVEDAFVLAAVWVMVKRRVLFDWIPR
jgi:hypothetical protein